MSSTLTTAVGTPERLSRLPEQDGFAEYVPRQKQQELHQAQLAVQRSQMQAMNQTIAQLQQQNDIAMLLLVFAGALAVTVLVAKSP